MANYPPSKLVVAMFMCMKKRFLTSLIFVIPSLVLCWAMPEIPAGETGSVTQVGWNPSEIPGIDRLVESVATEVKRTGNPSRIAAFDDVSDVMAHASEWRWYARDNGILLAIPVRERLGIAAKVEGERALEDVVRRLINQAGWGNPPVQVILVAGDEPCHERSPHAPCEVATPAASCPCD